MFSLMMSMLASPVHTYAAESSTLNTSFHYVPLEIGSTSRRSKRKTQIRSETNRVGHNVELCLLRLSWSLAIIQWGSEADYTQGYSLINSYHPFVA